MARGYGRVGPSAWGAGGGRRADCEGGGVRRVLATGLASVATSELRRARGSQRSTYVYRSQGRGVLRPLAWEKIECTQAKKPCL